MSASGLWDLRGVGVVVCVGVDVIVCGYSCGPPFVWLASCCCCWCVRRIHNAGPAEFSVHIFGVHGRRMVVVLICSWFSYGRGFGMFMSSYVRSGGGQRYPIMLRVSLLVIRPHSWATALNRLRYANPVHATPPTNPLQIPSVIRVGAGQGLFFVLAGVGVRIRYCCSLQRSGGDV